MPVIELKPRLSSGLNDVWHQLLSVEKLNYVHCTVSCFIRFADLSVLRHMSHENIP